MQNFFIVWLINRQVNKKAGVALLIAAIVISSSLLLAETYLYSPFQNTWTEGLSGQVISSDIANGSVFVLTAHDNYSANSYYYCVYKFNLTTGQLYWSSKTQQINGWYGILMEPTSYGSLLRYSNNTIYMMAFNGSGILGTSNANRVNFDLIEMNATTGKIFHTYNLAPLQNRASFAFGFTMNMIGKALYLGLVNDSAAYGQPTNSSFEIYYFLLGNGAPLLLNYSAIIIPPISGWGANAESVFTSGQTIAYCINSLGIAIIHGPNGNSMLNIPGKVFGFVGQSLYYTNSSSGSLKVGKEASVTGGYNANLFEVTQPYTGNVSYEYQVETNNAGIFYVVTNAYPYGVFIGGEFPAGSSFERIQAYNSNGTMLWNRSLPTGSQADVVFHEDSNDGNIIITALSQSSSEILLMNNLTGKVKLEINYHFLLNSRTGTSYPFAPPQFRGVLIYSGEDLLYLLGEKIAMTEIK